MNTKESIVTPNNAQRQIRLIQQSVVSIDRAVRRLRGMLRKSAASAGVVVPRRRLKLSPQRRAALKLHGSYLGRIRQLKPNQKAQVRALKAKRGYHAAIALAKRLAQG
jgi:hypothetical protein